MFGATVLVPALTGLDVAAALLFAGLGTLLFHLITEPARCPRSWAPPSRFIGGLQCHGGAQAGRAAGGDAELLPYACGGVVACAGLVYTGPGLGC